MLSFRPRIGKQNESASDRSGGHCTQNVSRITHVHLDVRQSLGLDSIKNLYDAVFIGLAANEHDVWVVPRLPEQVLAASEPDFQPRPGGTLPLTRRVECHARQDISQ
jgi:hypothetical protein